MEKFLDILNKIIEVMNFVGFIVNSREKYNAAKTTIKIEGDK